MGEEQHGSSRWRHSQTDAPSIGESFIHETLWGQEWSLKD